MLQSILARQPLLLTTVVTAAVSLAIAYGVPISPEAKAPMITLLVALATGFLHRTVSSPATVVEAVADAATKTAEQLTTQTVGVAGKTTETGLNVVGGVVEEVVGAVGGLVPALTGKGS